MKIIKKGTTIPFTCELCDCEFVAGIHAVAPNSFEGNYYADCPSCGAQCHTDTAKIARYHEKEKKRDKV